MQTTPPDAAPPIDIAAVMDAMAPLLGLVIRPEYRAGIAANIQVTVGHAALVLGFPLDDAAEPAAVFQP